MKLWKLLFLILFLFPAKSWAVTAGTCELTSTVETKSFLYYEYTCLGDGATGDVADVTISYNEDYPFFYGLFTWPIVGGTAPSGAADILLFDASFASTVKLDVLGSTDGSTAVNGLNGISATVPQWIPPQNSVSGSLVWPPMVGNYTLSIANETTVSCDFAVRVYLLNPNPFKK